MVSVCRGEVWGWRGRTWEGARVFAFALFSGAVFMVSAREGDGGFVSSDL